MVRVQFEVGRGAVLIRNGGCWRLGRLTQLLGGRDQPDDPDPGSSRSQMSDKARSGDPRKRAQESEKRGRRRSKRELSIGYILFAWIVLFVIWFAAGSLLIAAIVFAALLFVGVAAISRS